MIVHVAGGLSNKNAEGIAQGLDLTVFVLSKLWPVTCSIFTPGSVLIFFSCFFVVCNYMTKKYKRKNSHFFNTLSDYMQCIQLVELGTAIVQ